MNDRALSFIRKPVLCLVGFMLIYAESVIAGQGITPTSATIDIFFTGKRRSNLEPCGCRSRQASGLQYEATLYDKLAATSSSLRLDCGEWTNIAVQKYPLDAMKTRYLLRGMRMLGLDAVGVGLTDANLSPDFFKSLEEKYPDGMPNMVSAAVCRKDQPGRTVFPASRIVQLTLADGTPITVGITSALAPKVSGARVEPFQVPFQSSGNSSGSAINAILNDIEQVSSAPQENYTIKPAREALAPIVTALRPRVDLLVVLYSGDLGSARELVKGLPEIDCLVAAGAALEKTPQALQEGRTVILGARNMFGREVGRARIVRADDGWHLVKAPEFIAVGPDFVARKDLTALIEEFKKETRGLKVPLPPPNAPKIYAGAQVCADCHAKEYESWKKTRHARALQTLTDKGQQFNPECLKCHVTGYQQANGFYTLTHSPSLKLANVQCELCHGPARDHAETQQKFADNVKNWMDSKEYEALVQHAQKILPRRKTMESTCIRCHTPENDDNFVYDDKLSKCHHDRELTVRSSASLFRPSQ